MIHPLMHDYTPWLIEPDTTFLNHGSFGACPEPVLAHQQELRASMEAQPMRFFCWELPDLAAQARATLADFLGARPEDLAWVPNATAGVNTVLRSLQLSPGDELLITNHAYSACRNALEFVANQAGARVVVARIPFPIVGPEQAMEAVLAEVTSHTRLALLDHVTSPTALVLPVAEMIAALADRGVPTLVDGAHAPGMIPLELKTLGAAYYTGNCHKWLCAPKGAGFLWVREDLQPGLRPLAISHGAGVAGPGSRERFRLEMDWTGTHDPTPYLAVPRAIQFMGQLLPGGWPALMLANRALALQARAVLAAALDIPAPCPEEMVGSMATLPLPPSTGPRRAWPKDRGALQEALLRDHGIEVPVTSWPAYPGRVLRISAQKYNDISQYKRLANLMGSL